MACQSGKGSGDEAAFEKPRAGRLPPPLTASKTTATGGGVYFKNGGRANEGAGLTVRAQVKREGRKKGTKAQRKKHQSRKSAKQTTGGSKGPARGDGDA